MTPQPHRLLLVTLALLMPLLAAGFLPHPGSAAQAEEPVTLDLWHFQSPSDKFMPAVIEAFQAVHPNITLEVTVIPEDDYVVKVDTAMAAASAPDIGFLYERRWAKADKVLPLDDMIAAEGIDLADLNRAAMGQTCVIDGQTYCLGSLAGAVVLFYNKALFDAAGLEHPSPTEPLTVDEYAALAAQLSVPNDDVSQRVWGATAGAPLWMSATNIVSDDGRQVEGFVNDEATKHAFEVLSTMVKEGYAPSQTMMQSPGFEAAEDLFLQGKLAMYVGDFLRVEELEAAGVDYGIATLPVAQAGDPPYMPAGTDGFAVFSDSDHPAEAMVFISFLATEGQRMRVEVSGEPPLSAKAAEEFGWAKQGNVAARQEFLDAIGSAEPPLFVPGYWDVIAPPLTDAFNLIAEGEATTAVLDEIAPRMQDELNQAWETWEQFGG